jgi:HrpA-like RNA helicase
VTQPRKLAATSVAMRVAEERNEFIGLNSAIGYSIRFDHSPPRCEAHGTVEYITTGILLMMVKENLSFEEVTHIFIDEVHERDLVKYFTSLLR